MQITFGNTVLASPSLTGAPLFGLTLNGREIIQETDFLRAVAATFYARGNRTTELAFNVTRLFTTLREAQRFALTHATGLPSRGTLQVLVGEGADTETVYLEGVVLESADIVSQRGVAIVVRYVLKGPAAWTSDVPASLPGETEAGEGTLVLRRGQVSITSGATSVAVTFSAALSSVPAAVSVTISRPTGEAIVGASVRQDTIATTGFTADLDAPTPSANYKLNYVAIE